MERHVLMLFSILKMSHREVSICRAERMRVEVFIGIDVASTGNISCHAITGDAGRKTTFLLAS